jgi:two-component system chemotaxis sensor kinase CheA
VASEREVLQLLFAPGFSTAREVTDLSGRGVGLDVVKSHIEELKGDVAVETTPGGGTVFRLTVPVSLTLQTILRARADGRVYAFPHSFVEEARPIGPLDLIEVAGQPALRLGNQLIPVVDLAEVLGLPPAARRRVVIIGQAAGERVAFGVDAVEDIAEAVIKPVPRGVRAPLVGGFCSAEHGDAVPVLHVPSLIKALWALGSRRAASRQAIRQPRRILVVDDSPNTREVIRTILEDAGYTVETAKDGEEALVRLAREPAHLVVTDIEMPRLDGFSLCRRLRGQAETADLPIVLVTSRATEHDRRRGTEVGANAYIEKRGFDQDHLVRAIKELLDWKGGTSPPSIGTR